jgi:sugar phosphate isomerase/epimerase
VEIYGVAEDVGVSIALENLPSKYWFVMSTPQDFIRMYRETNLPVGITLDLGHANLEGQIEPFFSLLADRIIHIHASNNDGTDDQHNGIGDGNIDYGKVAEMLRKISYSKSVIIESFAQIPENLQKLKQLFA